MLYDNYLWEARSCTNEAMSWLDEAIENYRNELEARDGHDTGVYGGEIQQSIDELLFLQSRIQRLHREKRIISKMIEEYQREYDRLADMADGDSL